MNYESLATAIATSLSTCTATSYVSLLCVTCSRDRALSSLSILLRVTSKLLYNIPI
jgi:hypothetical protein